MSRVLGFHHYEVCGPNELYNSSQLSSVTLNVSCFA